MKPILLLLCLHLASCATASRAGRSMTGGAVSVMRASAKPLVLARSKPQPCKAVLSTLAYPVAMTGAGLSLILFVPGVMLSGEYY